MNGLYDMDGQPMDVMAWAKAFEDKSRILASEVLPDGTFVSTVWLGIDHSFGTGKPLIFETMVFKAEGILEELDCDRYSTRDEAMQGHKALVALYSKGKP